ncbi:uncharacterized protein LOC114530948 isoform X2 [Dendronephthya gigantea]|nr:uncharacterized protein LOC114530948 isoform X2 [Dendronephthya gigantea]
MLYDPVNNLPYPCDSEAKPKISKHLNRVNRRSFEGNGLRRVLVKRADGDSIPIKLQPCPFPNSTQEHRWEKTIRRSSLPLKRTRERFLRKLWQYKKRNDVIRKISPKEEAIRGQLYAGTDINTGYGGVGLTGASLSVINMLPYIHAFDTKTGMPYVCDPDKKKPDKKIDNKWKMIVAPCPDFKKCLFPWTEAKDCKTSVDDNSPESPKRRWIIKRVIWVPVLTPPGSRRKRAGKYHMDEN